MNKMDRMAAQRQAVFWGSLTAVVLIAALCSVWLMHTEDCTIKTVHYDQRSFIASLPDRNFVTVLDCHGQRVGIPGDLGHSTEKIKVSRLRLLRYGWVPFGGKE